MRGSSVLAGTTGSKATRRKCAAPPEVARTAVRISHREARHPTPLLIPEPVGNRIAAVATEIFR